MGKSKANKHSKQVRDNPTGVVNNRVDSDEVVIALGTMSPYSQTALSSETLKSLSKQLQSSSIEDRDCACHALAGLIRNDADSCAALHEGLIKILGPLLLDVSPSVCHSAASALHTIISKGGDKAIKLATEHDILTPLVALLKKIPSQWKPHASPGEKIDTSTATLIETVNTLNILSESSPLAVDRIHRENVVPMLIGYLDLTTYGLDVVTTVTHFLSTVTEDQGNTDYTDFLRKEVASKFLDVEDSNPLLKSLSLMILLNLNHHQLNSELGRSIQEVVDILNSSLRLDHRKAASLVMDHLPTTHDDDASNEMEEDSVDSKLLDVVESADRLVSTQIKCLEILTNLCCSGDDADSEEFYQDESCSEGSLDDEGLEEGVVELNPEFKKALHVAQIFQLVIAKAQLPATNVIEVLIQHRSGKLLLKRYEMLQSLAFLCLSNLVMAFEVDEMGGSKELFDIWCGLAVLTFEGNRSDEMMAAATASMRAIIRKLSFHKDIVNLLKLEDIALLCQRVAECVQPQSKVNLLQVLGTLGSMAAGVDPPLLEPRSIIVRGIGKVLLDTACSSSDLWITAEAMDAIFDVFKEDHTDAIIGEIQLVEQLRTLAPAFKHRVHAQRRNLPGDHLPVVMTAKDNLLRFVKYKTKQRSLANR